MSPVDGINDANALMMNARRVLLGDAGSAIEHERVSDGALFSRCYHKSVSTGTRNGSIKAVLGRVKFALLAFRDAH